LADRPDFNPGRIRSEAARHPKPSRPCRRLVNAMAGCRHPSVLFQRARRADHLATAHPSTAPSRVPRGATQRHGGRQTMLGQDSSRLENIAPGSLATGQAAVTVCRLLVGAVHPATVEFVKGPRLDLGSPARRLPPRPRQSPPTRGTTPSPGHLSPLPRRHRLTSVPLSVC